MDGARRKRLGMRAGWPDLEIIEDGMMFFLEVKQRGKYASKVQKELHKALAVQGFFVAIVHDCDEAKRAVDRAREIRRERITAGS